MNPRKVVIWGIGNDYESIINQLKFEIYKNNIICEALVCRDQDAYVSKKDGFPVVKTSEFYKLNFDYLVISSNKFFDEIRNEAIKMGIEPKCILDGRLFHQPLFDFKRYVSLIENPITILSDDCWGDMLIIDCNFSSHLHSLTFIGIEISMQSLFKNLCIISTRICSWFVKEIYLKVSIQ